MISSTVYRLILFRLYSCDHKVEQSFEVQLDLEFPDHLLGLLDLEFLVVLITLRFLVARLVLGFLVVQVVPYNNSNILYNFHTYLFLQTLFTLIWYEKSNDMLLSRYNPLEIRQSPRLVAEFDVLKFSVIRECSM